MVLRLIDPKCAVPWIHPDQRGDEHAMLFHIVPLTEGQARKLNTAHPTSMVNGAVVLDRSSVLLAMFLSNVSKIENVMWPGSDAPVTIEGAADLTRFVDSFPAASFDPIYAAIQNTAILDEGAAKNFGGSRGSMQ